MPHEFPSLQVQINAFPATPYIENWKCTLRRDSHLSMHCSRQRLKLRERSESKTSRDRSSRASEVTCSYLAATHSWTFATYPGSGEPWRPVQSTTPLLCGSRSALRRERLTRNFAALRNGTKHPQRARRKEPGCVHRPIERLQHEQTIVKYAASLQSTSTLGFMFDKASSE
jgi:hypothetical protein